MNAPSGDLWTLAAELERVKDGVAALAANPELRSHPPNRCFWGSSEWRDTVNRLVAWVDAVGDGLATGEPDAVDRALDYLWTDLYYFRSGYARERLAQMLAQVDLNDAQKARARTSVLACVKGRKHCKHPGISKLAGAVADNELRRALLIRLHDASWATSTRALRCLMSIRHPGYDDPDIAAARQIALHRGDWRIARRFWSREWQAELGALATSHNPDRAAAKQLLRSGVEWREIRRARKGRPLP